MDRTAVLILGVLGVLAVVTAQPYRCDWSVVGIAGGDLSSTSYRCGATAGQTAVGTTASSAYQAFIGFWQLDVPVGVQEEVKWSSEPALETRLCPPAPNPSRAYAVIRYSLSVQTRASVELVDLSGRVVRSLVKASQKPGRYSVTWNGTDARGRTVPNGVYFLKFQAGDNRQTEKVVLQR
jgi:hypothetical protein